MGNKLRTLTLADIATLTNASVGVIALSIITIAPAVAARLILVAAMLDAIDGILARHYGSSSIGIYLDSLSDVVSFVIAPALLLTTLAPLQLGQSHFLGIAALGTAVLYTCSGLLRLAFYTQNDADTPYMTGVPTTLAATIITALYITGTTTPIIILGVTFCSVYLMLCNTRYPDLLTRDALIMGSLQGLAILFPTQLNSLFSFSLLAAAILYLLLSPTFYWRDN